MLEYEWDRITIGSTLDAVLYAFKTKSYLLFNSDPVLYSLDTTDVEIDLGTVKYPKGSLVEDVWATLSYLHGLAGLHPLMDRIQTIRFVGDETLKITTRNQKVFKINFCEVHIFDLENILGLPPDFAEEVINHRVFDWFDVKSGMLHDFDEITDDKSNFVKKIKFFVSTRQDGNKNKKDLVSESLLSKEQLNSVDYSDTIARLKTIDMMNRAGIKGRKNGNNTVPVKHELWKREILPIKKSNYIKRNNVVLAGNNENHQDYIKKIS